MDDQPLWLMRQMQAALSTYEAFRERGRLPIADWLRPEHEKLITFCTQVDAWRADRA